MRYTFWSVALWVMVCSAVSADQPEAASSAPVVLAREIESLPVAQHLATPEVRVLLGYTRRPIHLPDGRMAVFSFSYSAPANWIFIVDGKDLSFERHAIPNNDVASHSAALGPDNAIYIMPYAHRRAYRFDVATKTFEQFDSPLDEGEYTWDAWGAHNGNIYFGTWPNALFGEYKPRTREWRVWKKLVPNTTYVTGFSEDEEGRIIFRAWGPDSVWMRYDSKTDAFDRIDVPDGHSTLKSTEDEEPFAGTLVADGRMFGVSNPSGRLWEVVDGERALLGDTNSPAQPTWWMKSADRAIFGISYYGSLFRYDLEARSIQVGQLDNRAKAGNSIMFVETITPDCVLGANYSQQNLFRVNPRTGECIESDIVVARTSGEPMCAVGFGGKAYVGIYTHALLSLYDPAKPFAFATNPREIAELHSIHQQTRPRAAVTDGKRVYFSVDGDYNVLGGALAIVDPESNETEVFHQLIKDQNLPSLAYDATSGLLWGGTDRWGQMRSHPPTQESAVVYAFDPEQKKVVSTLTPWPGVDVVTVHGASSDGTVIVSSGSEIALVDSVERRILYQGTSPIGVPSQLRLGTDGAVYGLFDGVLYRWAFPSNTLTPLARALDCRYLTESEPGTWILASSQSLFKVVPHWQPK